METSRGRKGTLVTLVSIEMRTLGREVTLSLCPEIVDKYIQ